MKKPSKSPLIPAPLSPDLLGRLLHTGTGTHRELLRASPPYRDVVTRGEAA